MQQYGDSPYQAAVPVVLFISFAVFHVFAFAHVGFVRAPCMPNRTGFREARSIPKINGTMICIASCIKLHQIALIANVAIKCKVFLTLYRYKKYVWQVLGRPMQEACEVWLALAVLHNFLAPGANAPSMPGRHMLWKSRCGFRNFLNLHCQGSAFFVENPSTVQTRVCILLWLMLFPPCIARINGFRTRSC